jgi:hypothetical protein
MKMETVYAYRMPNFQEAPDLVGLKASSFAAIARQLKEGDNVTVEVRFHDDCLRGYKNISIENGQVFIQRNYAPEY